MNETDFIKQAEEFITSHKIGFVQLGIVGRKNDLLDRRPEMSAEQWHDALNEQESIARAYQPKQHIRGGLSAHYA